MAKRIVIMAGGTGGHVFPALAVAQSLIEKGWQVSWLGTEKGLESRVIPENGIAIDIISVAGIRGKGVLSKITAVFGLFKACAQAVKILRQRKPDVVLGMGGFVAGPGGLMAKLLGIPLVIHEQNRIVGTTNRLLARLANRVLEAFPDSFKKATGAVCTGNPLRKQFVGWGEERNPTTEQSIKILVIGGSQGAQILNEVVPEAIAHWRIQADLPPVQIKHQTGTAMQAQVASRYQALGIAADAPAFINDMVAAYQWADMLICRAGAMTVSEVASVGIPAIFIPLPNAIDDHQTANARYLTDGGAGNLLMQKDLNAENLAEKMTDTLKRLNEMSRAVKQRARLDATEVVANYCIAEAKI
ncbi:MAG: undecaprenyldiphospho-muramoylpentapeptide beta-N-acetylglucosaminyltransferase [Methylococcaceae bacterium]|nr:undecaprenyldiphospho-muramoylpentapeptide beta-N-acetylglucosaminyltransferase [Methylococcaceae bacterium]